MFIKRRWLVFGFIFILGRFDTTLSLYASEITIKLPSYHSVVFVDVLTGWIAGIRGVFYTSDGGKTWQKKLSSLSPPKGTALHNLDIGSIAWADKNSIIVNAADGCLFGKVDGSVWLPISVAKNDGIKTVRFVNRQRGWTITSEWKILRTMDGGSSWQTQKEDVPTSVDTMYVGSRNELWIGGVAGFLASSKDGGNNWDLVKGLDEKSPEQIWCIRFLDSKRGWVLGIGNRISYTNDRGKTWNSLELPLLSHPLLTGISFADKNEGWIVGYADNDNGDGEGVILHTEDGGRNWNLQSYPSKECLFDVQALANGRVWVVGEHDLVMSSEDHGKRWKVFDLK